MVLIRIVWTRILATGHQPVEPDPYPHMDKPQDPEIGWTTSEDSNW